jgi:small subunit ribosomal protein S6
LREYELVYIVSPELSEEETSSLVERVNQFISSRGGVVDKVDNWGRRKLAYPIKSFREGNYFLTQFKLEPGLTRDLENSLRMSEDIIRHLVVRLDQD